ncbi:MAG: ABC transporter type 1, transmembrane domain-containing protein [Benjaminiella poitrasii]|nr:MAG: ABC transporter type 1, transmembrane domain-containing protein [Benjaminiella poitrasii]
MWRHKNRNRQLVVNPNDCLRLPTAKTASVFRRSLVLLIVTLLEISSWAFLFAWRLESAILERSKSPPTFSSDFETKPPPPPLYQIVDPSLAFIPRFYILILVIKSFTMPANPLDPSSFTKYSQHFLVFYSLIFVSALVRAFDYFLTNNDRFIPSAVEKSFAFIDLVLCLILWVVIVTSPTEIDHGELAELEDDDHGVLVLHDGRVVRNGRILSLESSASPLSSITFSWMNSLLKSVFKSRNSLTAASLWALPIRQRARENFKLFTETNSHQQEITITSLIQRIYLANYKIILFQFITAIGAVFFHYANPLFLRKLLTFIQIHYNHRPTDDNIIKLEKEIGYIYCIALFGCNVISTLIASQTLLWGRRWHVSIVHMLDCEIYAHTLRLKKAHQQSGGCFQNRPTYENEELDDENGIDESVPQKASIMSQDTEKLAELASCLHIFYTCPLEILTGIIFLYNILGNSFLAGLIVMVVALPSTHYVSRNIMLAQSRLTDAKSWRLRLLRELCEGIRTIKFLASERRWEQVIMNARGDELVKLIKLYTQNTILGLIWFATPVFVTTISFVWYTMVEKKTLDASTAFISIVLFNMLRDPLNVLPQAFIAYRDAKISLGNITTFLNTKVISDKTNSILQQNQMSYDEQVKVGFTSALSVFEWCDTLNTVPFTGPTSTTYSHVLQEEGFESTETTLPFRLFVPSIQFPPSKLSVISGPSQSGKTSMLAALLNDMEMIEGEYLPILPSRFLALRGQRQQRFIHDPNYNGAFYLHKVAYVAQTAWIEHGTLRENILFSESWDDARYRTVLHQCDLLRDLALFDNGDLTLTTDKGISTSEIIRHKISLARAVYSRAKTVIIDDIFAVFGRLTSTFIYENCIRGELMRHRTIIVASTYPDMFWARDAQLFIHLKTPLPHQHEGHIESTETDPEKIVELIKRRRAEREQNTLETKHNTQDDENHTAFLSSQTIPVIDEINALFENTGKVSNSLLHNSSTLVEDEFFDEASIIPDSIRFSEDEAEQKKINDRARDYAYATYYAACGGWAYWTVAILFSLLPKLANISENYWLKEGLVRGILEFQ